MFTSLLSPALLFAQAEEPSQHTVLGIFNQPNTIFWLAITLMAVIPTACTFWYKHSKDKLEAQLKSDMIARGMSADEIERVLKAGMGGKNSCG